MCCSLAQYAWVSQGHRSAIVASCASASKKYVATADLDVADFMLVVWDVMQGAPARLLFADDLAAAGPFIVFLVLFRFFCFFLFFFC